MNVAAVSVPQASPHDSTTPDSGKAFSSIEGLNNMFLKLLVAQLQHQSPLSPLDPAQFVGQLAQFSELSEVTQINQTLKELLPTSSGSTEPPSSGSTSVPEKHVQSATPDAWISSAVAVAQAAKPASSRISPAQAILNSNIRGVF